MATIEKYLIVSLGSIGRRHLTNLRLIKPHAEIAVWRQHTTNLGDSVEGADYQFSTLDEVLTFHPNAAIIASPSSKHLETAVSLANAGIHLLVEKPIANDLTGLSELLSVCHEAQLILMVGYNLRFLPSLVAFKQMVDTGKVGRVISVRAEVGQYLPDWRPNADYRSGVTANASLGGGVLLELSHELDYIYWMFGMPDRVSANGGQLSDLAIDVEDTVEMTLEYKSKGCLINIHLDMVQRSPIRCCRVVGDEGTLVWNAMKDQVEYYSIETSAWQVFTEYALADKNKMYLNELNHFFECIENNSAPLVSGQSGRDVLAIVDAARFSMDNNTSVEMGQYEQ